MQMFEECYKLPSHKSVVPTDGFEFVNAVEVQAK
jgi:hypothetical protein